MSLTIIQVIVETQMGMVKRRWEKENIEFSWNKQRERPGAEEKQKFKNCF